MSYYMSTTLHKTTYDKAIEVVTEALKKEGFGVLTQIDIKETLKKKIDTDFRKYIILGACNPHFAHKALTTEPKAGVFLPCNVVVEEHDNGTVEVSAADPVAMMASIDNKQLDALISEVRDKVKRVILETGNSER